MRGYNSNVIYMKLNHDKKAMINGLINYNTFNVKSSLPIGFLFIIFVQSSLQDGLSEKKFPQQSTIYKKNSKDKIINPHC